MKQAICERPECGVVLTPAQLVRGTRYCTRRCASLDKLPKPRTPGSISDIARQLGIARHALKQAMATGRYVDGVYTPRRKGRGAQ